MPRRRTPPPSSPLDARQRKLQEQQEKLQAETERLSRFVSEAPQIAAQRQKQRRDELIKRSAQSSRRPDASTIHDKRFDLHVAGTMPQRTRRKALKAERRQERLIFFGLTFLLALAVLLLWSNFHWLWHG